MPELPYQVWKTRYRLRIAETCGVTYDETENMIGDDRTLFEIYDTKIEPEDAADEEMSYWTD